MALLVLLPIENYTQDPIFGRKYDVTSYFARRA